MAETKALGQVLRAARARLEAAGIDGAAQDARLIVEHVTGLSRLDLIARPDQPLGNAHLVAIDAALMRRLAREPVHRILGARAFYGLKLTLSDETLEPRPDTEVLVDAVLPFLRARAAAGECRVLDLGTGTGAIALAILAEIPLASAVAVDISLDALETARRNADLNGLGERLETTQSDWYSAVDGEYDLIVSNPPYIPTNDIAGLDEEVHWFDPAKALDGGHDGLDCYRAIAKDAGLHLRQNGRIAVEIGFNQKASVTGLFAEQNFVLDKAVRDLAGNDRVLVFLIVHENLALQKGLGNTGQYG